jgi:hypothetical protein
MKLKAASRACSCTPPSSQRLSTVKYHNPSFDLQKVSKDMDLFGLVRREDIVAAAEEIVYKFDFGTD